MHVPESFKLGGFTITVLNGEQRASECYGDELTIVVDLEQQRCDEIFLHEVVELIDGIYSWLTSSSSVVMRSSCTRAAAPHHPGAGCGAAPGADDDERCGG